MSVGATLLDLPRHIHGVAELDAVERSIFQVPPALALVCDRPLESAIRRAAADRLQLIRALLLRFGWSDALEIRDYAQAVQAMESPPPGIAYPLRDLLRESNQKIPPGHDLTARFIVTSVRIAAESLEPWTDGQQMSYRTQCVKNLPPIHDEGYGGPIAVMVLFLYFRNKKSSIFLFFIPNLRYHLPDSVTI
jgi:hypothetical protein